MSRFYEICMPFIVYSFNHYKRKSKMASSWYEDQVTLEDPVMVSTCWNDNHAEVTSETN